MTAQAHLLKSISAHALLAAFLVAGLLLPAAAVIDFDRLLQIAGTRFGDRGVRGVETWRAFMEQTASRPQAEQLSAVNDFFNQRVRWRTDQQIYGEDDYWATPLETLARLEADCEDFTIAKYITLVSLGYAPRSLRLVYVIAQRAGGATQAHMVLAWYSTPGAMPLILDNIDGRILSANQRLDLRPVFSFNAADLWVAGSGGSQEVNPQQRLSRWRQVLDRISEEGLLANAQE